MIIRRIQPMPFARLFGVLYAALGLFIGFIASLVSLASSALGIASRQPFPGWSIFFGIGSIIFFPIIYGVLGFIGSLIMAALYNIFARMVGGIVVDVE